MQPTCKGCFDNPEANLYPGAQVSHSAIVVIFDVHMPFLCYCIEINNTCCVDNSGDDDNERCNERIREPVGNASLGHPPGKNRKTANVGVVLMQSRQRCKTGRKTRHENNAEKRVNMYPGVIEWASCTCVVRVENERTDRE